MLVESYRFGRIVIAGETYSSDVIIFHNRVLSPWWRREGHLLQLEDLSEVLKEDIERLIVGSGYSGRMIVPRNLIDKLKKMDINLVVQRTEEAVRTFNNSSAKGTAAALHLTC
jgi:hypothetical protein